MVIDWNDLRPVIEICGPIIGTVTLLYFRLSSKIDKTDEKLEGFRKELEQKIEQKFEHVEQRFMNMEQKFEQKFERIDQKFEKIDQKFDRLFEMLIIKNQFGRGHPIKKQSNRIVP